jgi:hypothetical protein
MSDVRIRQEGSFWVVVVDGDYDDRERFPTMEAAVEWSFKRAMAERPVTVALDRAKDDELVLCSYPS